MNNTNHGAIKLIVLTSIGESIAMIDNTNATMAENAGLSLKISNLENTAYKNTIKNKNGNICSKGFNNPKSRNVAIIYCLGGTQVNVGAAAAAAFALAAASPPPNPFVINRTTNPNANIATTNACN